MKLLLCLAGASTCLLSHKQTEVSDFSYAAIPATIIFQREVIQEIHGDEGTRNMTYYFSLNGDYAAMKPDPKSNMGMSLMVYTKDGTALMFNDRQKIITVLKMSRVISNGADLSNSVAEEIAYKKLSKDRNDISVIGTGKTKTICGYPAVEYMMENEGGKYFWYFAKVDFNPIKIYTMGLGDSRTQENLDRKEIRELKNNPMGVPVVNKNYLLVEMSSSGGSKDMVTKRITKKIFMVSTSGYKIINLSKKG